MDIQRIDGQTAQILRRRGLSDAEIAALTPEEALAEYCAYFGLQPWPDGSSASPHLLASQTTHDADQLHTLIVSYHSGRKLSGNVWSSS